MAANREHDVLLRSTAVAVLQAKVSDMLAQSTHPGAQLLDASQWLAVWITKPQPALGGRTPSELLPDGHPNCSAYGHPNCSTRSG